MSRSVPSSPHGPLGAWYGANYPERDPLSPTGVEQHRKPRPRPRGWMRQRTTRHPQRGHHRCPDGTRVRATAQYLPSKPGADPNADGIAGRADGVTVYRVTRSDGEPVTALNVPGDHRPSAPDWSHIDTLHPAQKGEAA